MTTSSFTVRNVRKELVEFNVVGNGSHDPDLFFGGKNIRIADEDWFYRNAYEGTWKGWYKDDPYRDFTKKLKKSLAEVRMHEKHQRFLQKSYGELAGVMYYDVPWTETPFGTSDDDPLPENALEYLRKEIAQITGWSTQEIFISSGGYVGRNGVPPSHRAWFDIRLGRRGRWNRLGPSVDTNLEMLAKKLAAMR